MRREILRKNAFIIIFQKEFHEDFNHSYVTNQYLIELSETEKISEVEKEFIKNEVAGTLDNLEFIDQLIVKYSINWSINRINKIDLAILRLSIFEIIFDDTIDNVISINEALNLAKEYGGTEKEDSHVFINGILASILKDLPHHKENKL